MKIWAVISTVVMVTLLLTPAAGREMNADNWRTYLQYMDPLPDAQWVTPENNIIIRPGRDLSARKNELTGWISVTGEKSGEITGELKLLADQRTIIINPDTPFRPGEDVMIKLSAALINGNDLDSEVYQVQFSVRNQQTHPNRIEQRHHPETSFRHLDFEANTIQPLPEPGPLSFRDFPELNTMTLNNPAPGKIFITLLSLLPEYQQHSYLVIIDNYSTPVYFNRLSNFVYDFEPQSDTTCSYYNNGYDAHIVKDRNFVGIDSVSCGNGYYDNIHEFRVLENGNSLLICSDELIVNMDSLVVGGHPEAIVQGNLIQELDTDGNVVFQWRSWDHIPITDASWHIDLTAEEVDYIHMNSLDLDYDGHVLLSSRNLDEITKIDHETGEIIWRFGGENNQFEFINDDRGFSVQHHFRRLDNGHYTLYNNGNFLEPRFSDALEYDLDQTALTATKVWSYSDGIHYGLMMGSTQRLDNGNTLIGWGPGEGEAELTEVEMDGTIALEIDFPFPYTTYRGIKGPWETTRFDIEPDTLTFLYAEYPPGQRSIDITNFTDGPLWINHVSSHDSVFAIGNELPQLIASQQTVGFDVILTPAECGEFTNVLTVGVDEFSEYVADQVTITGNVYCNPNGDMNYDAMVNIFDIMVLVDGILSYHDWTQFQMVAGDLDSNEQLDVQDIVALVYIILNN